jgi:hypothetical protein
MGQKIREMKEILILHGLYFLYKNILCQLSVL